MNTTLDHLQNHIKGSLKKDASLAATSWFKVGGNADYLFKPESLDDLKTFLKHCPADIPITVLGASSNLIIRDGGICGVVIKLGRAFTDIRVENDTQIFAGAFATDVNVAHFAADQGLTGLEFLSGIPGTIGGGLTMNAGAYGGEFKDVLETAFALTRQGDELALSMHDLDMAYRHTNAKEKGLIFTGALFQTKGKDTTENIKATIQDIKTKRESTQPVFEKTGGSTFANPSLEECEQAGIPHLKSWQMITQSGADEIKVGGAHMSDKHKNFMINDGTATASDLETLGEKIRQHVFDHFGVWLRWEIKIIGEK